MAVSGGSERLISVPRAAHSHERGRVVAGQADEGPHCLQDDRFSMDRWQLPTAPSK